MSTGKDQPVIVEIDFDGDSVLAAHDEVDIFRSRTTTTDAGCQNKDIHNEHPCAALSFETAETDPESVEGSQASTDAGEIARQPSIVENRSQHTDNVIEDVAFHYLKGAREKLKSLMNWCKLPV